MLKIYYICISQIRKKAEMNRQMDLIFSLDFHSKINFACKALKKPNKFLKRNFKQNKIYKDYKIFTSIKIK